MYCGYFVHVTMFSGRHYAMLKDMSFLGFAQDLPVSQTGYITRKGAIKTSRHIIKVCESVVIKELIYLLLRILVGAGNYHDTGYIKPQIRDELRSSGRTYDTLKYRHFEQSVIS